MEVPDVPPDPIAQLTAHHREVEKLFTMFEQPEGEDRRGVLIQIIEQLTLHAEVEEKAVYPVMRTALADGEAKVEEAVAEHQEVKKIFADLKRGNPDDPDVEEKVFALMTNVRRHVEEEEGSLLPELREALGPAALTEVAEDLRAAKLTTTEDR